MKVLVTGCCRLHRHARHAATARAWRRRSRDRQHQRLLRPFTQDRAPGAAAAASSSSPSSDWISRRAGRSPTCFAAERLARVVHLAAQAGVRYFLTNPHAYVNSNITGFLNILEACRHHGCEAPVFASSSSVYGANRKLPFSEHDNTDHPVSLYAATKKANELMAHTVQPSVRTAGHGTCAFSPSTGPGVGPTCRSRSLPAPSWRAGPSTSSIMARWSATSPTWTISWKRWSAFSMRCRCATPAWT